MIVMFKPFKVGDFIEAMPLRNSEVHSNFRHHTDHAGQQAIILPNGALSNGSLVNYSAQEFRRLNGLSELVTMLI